MARRVAVILAAFLLLPLLQLGASLGASPPGSLPPGHARQTATAAAHGPTATSLRAPTATLAPTATPAATATPVAGDCRAAHDAHTTAGPDGRLYPTWHPPVDPATGCAFGHEHGADPRLAVADTSLPAFGYVGQLAGHDEPHEGFKVFVGNPDQTGGFAYRLVFHMGTSGVGRYTERFHSAEWDYAGPLGEAHIAGMADTGDRLGSTCDNPRQGTRDFSTVGCADSYEIWSFSLAIHDPADPFYAPLQSRYWLNGAVAAFDPVTTRDPADNARLVYTTDYRGPGGDPLAASQPWRGCKREAYGGPGYARNAGKPTSSRTDPYGVVRADGPLVQVVAVGDGEHNGPKVEAWTCHATVKAPN
jgi:hypothetical protein